MDYDQLKLENQICFPVYAASRLITRSYQPLLDEIGLTYPQFLVLMVLWEEDELPVKDIAEKLILNTNTLTPLLKRMEEGGLVQRKRSCVDERQVIIRLTASGHELREKAAAIPQKLIDRFSGSNITLEDISELKITLGKLIKHMR